jgi:serine/threonine protein kinase
MTDSLKTRDVTLPPDVDERVDAACDRFERAWGTNRPLTIEEVVGDTPEPERSALLRHLILLDRDLRLRAGQTPSVADYQRWYSVLGLGWFAREFEANAANSILRYRLADELGHGGVGSVLRGYDSHMGRELAIKVLLEQHRGHAQLVQRFLEEARIGARLQHPGVVPVYDRGEFPDRRPFFTMKLVKGRTLADLLKERTQPDQDQARFLGIFEQIAQTMAYSHANGVIHRDLKPHNIMVGAFGEVQVMDWGFAKVLATEQRTEAESQGAPHNGAPVAESDTAPKLETERGQAMGTLQYMPPEQARGEIDRIDERSDVFGLGAILCEILTGRPPFMGQTQKELWAKARACDHAEPFAALDHSGADADLVQLTKRCLAANQEERPRNARNVATAMTEYLTSVAERKRAAELTAAKAKARAASERKARHLTLGLAAVLLVGTTVVTIFGVQAHKAREKAEESANNEGIANGKLRTANEQLTTAIDQVKLQEKKVEKRNDQLRTGLARRLARSLGIGVLPGKTNPELSDTEIEDLAELGETPDEKLRLQFVEEALRTPRTTRQLRDRAPLALHAVVGLDERRRAEVEALLLARLEDPMLGDEQKTDLALAVSRWDGRTNSGAARTARQLTRAMKDAKDPYALRSWCGACRRWRPA